VDLEGLTELAPCFGEVPGAWRVARVRSIAPSTREKLALLPLSALQALDTLRALEGNRCLRGEGCPKRRMFGARSVRPAI